MYSFSARGSRECGIRTLLRIRPDHPARSCAAIRKEQQAAASLTPLLNNGEAGVL